MTLETAQEVTLETTEAPVEETEVNISPETESEEVETQDVETQPEETTDDKLARLEREAAGRQKKIDRQVAAFNALQDKYKQTVQEREEFSQMLQQKQPEVEPSLDDTDENGNPKYSTHEEYVEALSDYRADKKLKERQEEFQVQQEQIQRGKLMEERLKLRHSQEAEYIADNPMYKTSSVEVDNYLKSLEVNNGTAQAVIDQMYKGNVPQVIDYFGSNDGENLDELGKINAMTPPEAAVEIYKIQQKISSQIVKKENKPKTKPVKVEGGKSASDKSLGKATGTEILDWVKQRR